MSQALYPEEARRSISVKILEKYVLGCTTPPASENMHLLAMAGGNKVTWCVISFSSSTLQDDLIMIAFWELKLQKLCGCFAVAVFSCVSLTIAGARLFHSQYIKPEESSAE